MTQGRPRILVAGSVNMDVVVQAARFPKPGESLIGRRVDTVPGGKGGNAAVAAARLGADVTFVGRVGTDPWGAALVERLEENGIDASGVVVDLTRSTGTAIIIVEDSGENSIVVVPGANDGVASADVDAALAGDARFDAIMLQFEIPIETVCHAIDRGRRAGIPVIVDAGPPKPVSLEQLAGATVISPNETEAHALTGITITSREDARRAARVIQEATGARYVVMKLGEQGSAGDDGHETIFAEPFEISAVDTTAAGDAYTGALAVQLCRGGPLRACMVYANATGALTATQLGAQPSLPTEADVEAFLDERGGSPSP